MLNSEDVEKLNKYHQIIGNQLNRYTDYLNSENLKLNFLFYHSMIEFFTDVKNANINKQYTEYCIYILDRLKEFPIHTQYIRALKLKKINKLNDTEN